MLKYFLFVIACLVSLKCLAEQCQTNAVKLQVLGSGGPELDDGRHSSGYLIWYNNQARVLIDAGPGTSSAFSQSAAKFEDLQGILLTHLHVDHSADLPALIKGGYFTERTNDLALIGPAGNDFMPATSSYLHRLLGDKGAFRYLTDYVNKRSQSAYKIISTNVPLTQGQQFTYQLSEQFTATATTVHHGPIAAIAWRVEVAGCSIVFSGDMSNQFEVLAELAEQADILVATNAVPDNASSNALNLHMPPSTIARIAKQAQVKKLLLSHFMNRTLGIQQQTLGIIKQIYAGPVIMATDGLILKVK